MLWSDFGPYVLTSVDGCPIPLLEHHARLVSIDFCRRTLCWQNSLSPAMASGASNEVALMPPSSTQIVKIKAVSVNGTEFELIDSARGISLARKQYPGDFVFTIDNKTLHVYPLQEATTPIIADVCLAPTLAATELDAQIAESFVQDISEGVIASLLRTLKQGDNGMINQGIYEKRVNEVAMKFARGLMNVKLPSFCRYL